MQQSDNNLDNSFFDDLFESSTTQQPDNNLDNSFLDELLQPSTIQQPGNNLGDNFLDDLFLYQNGIFPVAINDIHLNQINGFNDDDLNEFLKSAISHDADHGNLSTTDGNNSLELNRIIPDSRKNNTAILDEGQFIQNSTVHQNSEVTYDPNPQKANGGQDNIMYQMDPTLFDFIVGNMVVKQQPKANNRFRYQSDGSRFLPDSRYNPMSINLPDLRSIILATNQTLGIVMTIVTNTNNPQSQTFVHANDIVYRVDDAIKIAYGCFFVPLENFDIQNCEKKFPRSSIIYKKCDEYTFDLTPFNTSSMFGTTEKYMPASEKKNQIGNAAKGKKFKEDYKLLSYKIVFQLAVKQDNVVCISNISCETETVDEQKVPTKKSGKRSASVSTETLSEEENSSDTQISTSSKKFKSSTPSSIGLPVTRVSTRDNETLIIDNDLR